MAKLVFRWNLQCPSVADISRLGLFLLGTAPGNTSSTYFVALWEGDLQLAVLLVILSTLLSPLTSLFWWNTLGKVLLTNATTDALIVPIRNIIEFISIMVIPIFIGIYMAAKFPTLGKFMEQIRKPIIVIGMTGCIVIYYFQYQHFFSLFTLSHFAACSVLAFGSSLLAGLTAYFCRLSKEQILSIVITCGLQNATLTYAVINGTLEDPSTLYAMLPANAQILFTSLPIIFLWLLFQGSWRLMDCVQSKGKHCRSISSQTQSVAVIQENPYPMVRIADIKEAWSDQHNIRPLWC